LPLAWTGIHHTKYKANENTSRDTTQRKNKSKQSTTTTKKSVKTDPMQRGFMAEKG
jgi:hypothetical protein